MTKQYNYIDNYNESKIIETKVNFVKLNRKTRKHDEMNSRKFWDAKVKSLSKSAEWKHDEFQASWWWPEYPRQWNVGTRADLSWDLCVISKLPSRTTRTTSRPEGTKMCVVFSLVNFVSALQHLQTIQTTSGTTVDSI